MKQSPSLLRHLSGRPLASLITLSALCLLLVMFAIRGLLISVDDQRAYEVADKLNHFAAMSHNPAEFRRLIPTRYFNRGTEATIPQIKLYTLDGAPIPGPGVDDGRNVTRLSLRQDIREAMKTGIFPRRARDGRTLIFPIRNFAALPRPHALPTRHPLSAKIRDAMNAGQHGFFEQLSGLLTHKGRPKLRTFRAAPGEIAAFAAVDMSRDWAQQLIRSVMAVLLLVSLTGLAGFLLISIHASKSLIIQPLSQILFAVHARRQGHKDCKIPVSGILEFDEIITQWNYLVYQQDEGNKQKHMLTKVLENSPIGILVGLPDGSIEYTNPAMSQMVGYSLAEMLGKTPRELLHPDDDTICWRDMQDTLRSGQMWTGETSPRTKDGSELLHDLLIFPIIGRSGELEQIVAMCRDITERRRQEIELEKVRDKAATAARAKADFISNMSHELRTPLHTIIGFAELIEQEKFGELGNPQYVEFSRMIGSSANTLLNVMNSILDLARLDTHRQVTEDTPFLPNDAIQHLIARVNEEAAKRNVSVQFHDRSRNRRLIGDEAAFRRLTGHLLDNAVKFNTLGGTVDVTLYINKDDQMALKVRDSGIGIAKDQIAMVTDPFHRAEWSLDQAYGGIGLGLTLVREIAEAHGGHLKITSPKSGGTLVQVTFPAERVVKPAPLRQSA